MRTNVDIDDKLMEDAMKALGVKTKREAVEAGLKAVISRKAKKDMANMRGIGWGWEEENPGKAKKNKTKAPEKKRTAKNAD